MDEMPPIPSDADLSTDFSEIPTILIIGMYQKSKHQVNISPLYMPLYLLIIYSYFFVFQVIKLTLV